MNIRRMTGAARILLRSGFAICTATLANTAHAGVYCMAPRAPMLYSSKPSKPFCAAMRNCSSFDVEQYRSQIKSYFDDLEQYLLDVDKFKKQAYEYVECEAKAD